MSEATVQLGPSMPIPMPNEPDGPTYIPEFSPRFTESDLSHSVKLNGKEVGFCVGDIHPARRWACSRVELAGGQPRLIPSDGELLTGNDFITFYKRWSARVCLPDGRVIAIASTSKFHDPELEPVPSALGFVDRKLDAEGKPIPINFDPMKAANRREKRLYRADGEPFEVGERDLSTKLKGLQELKALGILDNEKFGEAVSALLGGQITPEPSEMPAGFDSIRGSDEEKLEEESESSAEIQPKHEMMKALCGKECKGTVGKLAHERKCKTCLQMKGDEESVE